MTKRLVLMALAMLACGGRFAAAASCTISATSIAFGNYSGATLEVTGTLTVKCTKNSAYQIALNAGTSSGATITSRRMTGPASSHLGYGLYSNASYTSNWGNSSGTGWVTGTGTGSNQTIYVYAQVPASQYPQASTTLYSDTITASVSGSAIATSNATFGVTATVQKACGLSATNLAFGNYAGTLINSTAAISVTCTSTTTYNVGLNAGTASGATVTNRSMTGPSSALLGYKLFRDVAHTQNWGNTVGTNTEAGTGTGTVQSLTVYGQLPAGESAPPGNYTDTITATITY